MNKQIVIGISGFAGSGKNFVASYLFEKYGFLTLAFADSLKSHCKEVHGWNGEKDEAGRRLLQLEGTEKHRVSYEDVWIDFMQLKIRMAEADGFSRIAIADMRFPNEFEFVLRHMYGYAIRVGGRKYNMSKEAESHPSETALNNHTFDFMIDNGGDAMNTYSQIDDMVARIL